MRKPTTADGYPSGLAAEARRMCLYVATILGDLLDEIVVVGGLGHSGEKLPRCPHAASGRLGHGQVRELPPANPRTCPWPIRRGFGARALAAHFRRSVLVPYLIIDQQAVPEAHVGTRDLNLGPTLAVLDDARNREISARLRDRGFTPARTGKAESRGRRGRFQRSG